MDYFDVIVLGTGLAESITAAALSKAGYSVAHVDTNQYYGGDDASLTAEELVAWADARAEENKESDSPYLAAQRRRFTSISRSGNVPPQSRQYCISLTPTLVPSIGPLIDSLIASGVSRYGGFKLLERVALFDSPGKVKPVPANKEDVFKNKLLSLVEKRRLMRFLMFAGGDFEGKPELQGNKETPFTTFLRTKFSLNEEAVCAIAYALAFCISDSDPTLPALQRVRRYLRATGRYGPSPFLVGHYGGAGEIAQGFCRTSAVGGATYILGRNVTRISLSPESGPDTTEYTLELEDFEGQLRAGLLIPSLAYLSSDLVDANAAEQDHVVVRCIAIVDTPIHFSNPAPVSETIQASSASDTNEGSEQLIEQSPSPSQDASINNQVDTALLVFPPKCIASGSETTAVNVLVTGEASMSAPPGRWILYITMPLVGGNRNERSAEELLRPYLDATLSLAATPSSQSDPQDLARTLFTVFYKEHVSQLPPLQTEQIAPMLVQGRAYSAYLPEVADSAASSGEAMFWQAVRSLKAANRRPRRNDETEKVSKGSGNAGETASPDVGSFWPPLDYVEDDDEGW